jgi:DNA-binding GntR family transcriptional regulator
MPRPTVRDGVASERVADALRVAILRGDFAPGTRIRQEAIASEYGASRVPVREALRILEADGLITVVANTGAWVSRLSLDECIEMYQIRERIEPLLLRYSIPNLSTDVTDRLLELVVEIERAPDVETFLRKDQEFHLLSYSGATTSFLGEIVDRLWNTTQHYRRAYVQLLDERGSRILNDEHHMLASAIHERDSEVAEHILRGHINRTRRGLAHHPDIFA